MALIVVAGPPASGKTTWVLASAQPGDIIVDFDRIANALTIDAASEHTHHRAVREVTFKARRAAIDAALGHRDTVNVYVIDTSPSPDTLATYQRHGARIVVINPGRDVVLDRCRKLRPPALIAAAERWYKQHPDAEHNAPAPISAGSRAW